MIDDLQIEARLRRLAAPPRPGVPGEVHDYVRRLPVTHPRPRVRVRFVPRTSRGRAFLGIAAALLLAVAGLGARRLMHEPAATPVEPGQWAGLEWRDVTDDLPFGWPVRWAGGYAMIVSEDSTLKLSSDALNWTPVAAAPQLSQLAATPNGLIGLGAVRGPCEGANSCAFTGGKPWLSTDGIGWHQATDWAAVSPPSAQEPLNANFRYSLIGDTSRALYATKDDVYVTTDGATWRHATLPPDMASAIQRTMQADWPSGYVAQGLVPRADGSSTMTITDDSGKTYSATGDQVTWRSADGLTWSRADVNESDRPWLHWSGSRGIVRYAYGLVEHSTDGGRTWVADPQMAGLRLDEYSAASQVASDGNRVVAAFWAGPAPTFWVTYGDGRWSQLAIVGDLSRADVGPMLLTANGILLFGGERMYFGQAVPGSAPRGLLLTPRPRPTEGPSLTPMISWGATATP